MAKWTRGFDGDIEIDPPLGAEELARIPAGRGVFLMEGPGGEPILLATAASIRSRLRFRLAPPEPGQSRRVDLRQVATHLRWRLACSHFETDLAFLALARRVYPQTYRGLLSVQPAWFVHVDPDDPCPWFRRTREVFAAPGRYFGPFPDKHAAQRFVQVLQDAFDLCRYERILRRAPHGTACMYAQMGRCREPCDGSIPMDQYRRTVLHACQCAAGGHARAARLLETRMHRLAGRKRYEQAANLKVRGVRLEELERTKYTCVAAAECFQYILVQPGGSPEKAAVFLVDRGFVRTAPALAYPPKDGQLRKALAAMETFAAAARTPGPCEREVIALVSHYLFGDEAKGGLILRYQASLTASMLGERIESAAAALKLRRRRAASSRSGKPRAAFRRKHQK